LQHAIWRRSLDELAILAFDQSLAVPEYDVFRIADCLSPLALGSPENRKDVREQKDSCLNFFTISGHDCFLPFCLDRTDYFVDLGTTIFIGQARVFEIGFKRLSALAGRIGEPAAVFAQGLYECARVSTVFGTSALITGVESAVVAIKPEIRPIPQWYHSKHARLYAHHARWMITLHQMQFLEIKSAP
jgi:hypothetical protein